MQIHHPITYLALGDSYTIGEGLPLRESFPYQLIQLLRAAGQHAHAPEIVAQTGFTTRELATQLIHTQLEPHYDWVSLLIGVNNQYRALSLREFAEEFEFLLHKAIHLSKRAEQGVFTLTIPDWTLTPFAQNESNPIERLPVADYNVIVKQLSHQYQVACIDISADCNLAAQTAGGLCKDDLHYSGATHAEWCKKIMQTIYPS